MTEKEIEKEIKGIISDVSGFDESEITAEKDFFKDLEIDSVKAIEITVAIEKKFKIAVRDEDVPNITNIRQATELVKKLLERKEDIPVRRAKEIRLIDESLIH
ncbi:MAG: acyl carrier protein [Thermodesulfovibrionales bacterium]|nr:acyl carrier protein [Thermodesulfovibrionales bacterium]